MTSSSLPGVFADRRLTILTQHHFGSGALNTVKNAAMWGFGATLGADAANSLVGGMKDEWHKHEGGN